MSITREFLRTIDWSRTPLGRIEDWPRRLQCYVDMILELPTPAIIFWGPEQTQIYNDGYAVIMGPRHPRYFGAAFRDCWPETCPVIIPWMRQVLDEGRPVEVARRSITLMRHGFTEDAYFTFTFSPLRDDEERIAGVYQPVIEVTDMVLGERRNETLRSLMARQDVLRQAVDAFDADPKDVPLAGIYVWSDAERCLHLVASSGFASAGECHARLKPVQGAIARAFATNASLETDVAVPARPWPEPVRSLFLAPARRSAIDPPLGVIAFGVSPRSRFDACYRAFFEAAADAIGSNLSAQRAEQAEKESIERERSARRDAESANRAKDEFFAILGHELRNPLAPIGTALRLMRLRGDETLARERTIIERQVGHITRLVDDLLDVARITRGKVDLKREPVEIAEVVAKAIEMASPLLEERRHHLEVAVPARGLVVDGDTSRLAQVVANLLTNAAKYTHAGGHVRVCAEKTGDRVTLHVADDGVGIAPEVLPAVFEPFLQEHQALDRAQGGLGLGLTIVANLVKLHGGAVTAHSEGRGRGSTFTVALPLSAASVDVTRRSAVAVAPLPRVPGDLRVLVVDDNEDAAELLAEALHMFGCRTCVAHDGPETLRVAGEFAPDVALLDIGLPVMDGYELAGRLRGTPRGERIHLVAVTGYGQESDRRRAAEAGFDAHLVKPVDIDRVFELIGRYRADTSRSEESPCAPVQRPHG
jgi:signal transduction histidine kinase/ActR/RegA family two-component response regulator